MKGVYRKGTNFFFDPNYAKPTCGPTDVIVRVKAAAINPIDYKARWPLLGPVVGIDVAGYVYEKGSDVSHVNIGDEVYGTSWYGSLAEYSRCESSKIALKPKTASFIEAAAMPCTYLTSLQGLRDYGCLGSGERILIIGASGGCGISAIQVAKALGAKDIVCVCSGKNADLVKSLGATEVVDYTKETVKDFCRGEEENVPEQMKFDVIFDAASSSGAGENYKDSSMELLKLATLFKKHGQYVCINGGPTMWLRLYTIGYKANQHLFLAQPNTLDLDHLASLFDDGKLKPVTEKFSFTEENIMKGFELLKSRRAVGKIVFDMGDE